MKKSKKQQEISSYLNPLFKGTRVQYVFGAQDMPCCAIVVSNRSGNYQLYGVDFCAGFENQVTHTSQGRLFGSISSDGQFIYTLNDKDNNEKGHFVQTSFKNDRFEDITPNLKDYFSYSIDTSIHRRVLCFTAALEGKNHVFLLRKDQKGDYRSQKKYTSEFSLSEPVCSAKGRFVCVAETNNKTDRTSLVFLPTTSKNNIIRSRWFVDVTPLAFSLSQPLTILALQQSKGWQRPIFYDLKNKRVTKIQNSEFRGDIWVLEWNEEQNYMILNDVYQARQRLYFYNLHTQELKRIGPEKGSFNFHFNSVALLEDDSLILKWQDFNNPPRLINIEAPDYKEWEELSQWSDSFQSKYSFNDEWVRSSDNKRVHMWIARPKKASTPIPFVVDLHGGPHGVVGDEFSPEAQAWLKKGFGYCAVNYRGSISFRQKFKRKIYGEPGRWEVEDAVAARQWLVKNGYAEVEEIILHGWSWGGYVTLLALGKYPDFWSCGIAGSAVADCIKQYEDEPAYLKARDKELFKGAPRTKPSRYVKSSPITYANNIKVPILLFHGKNDARCPARQIRCFVEKMRKLKKDISIEWFESGHTGKFTNIDLRTKVIDKSIKFALNI